MSWKFWKRSAQAQGGGGVKLPGPKELPQQVGRQLVVTMREDPDWVWNLRSVSKPREGDANTLDIRIYSPAAVVEAGITVRNYHSLDDHGDLILFEGYYGKKTPVAHLEKR